MCFFFLSSTINTTLEEINPGVSDPVPPGRRLLTRAVGCGACQMPLAVQYRVVSPVVR